MKQSQGKDEIQVTQCLFKRKEKSSTERGILIGDGQIIIDKNYKPVKAWNYYRLPEEGLMIVKL